MGFARNDNKFDPTSPIMVVPFIEDNPAMLKLYKEDLAKFWITVLEPTCDVLFLIIDGAHRWKMSTELKLEMVYSEFMRPEISVGEMVHHTIVLPFTCHQYTQGVVFYRMV